MRCKIPEINFPENVEIGPVLLEGGFPREAEPYLRAALESRGLANDWINMAVCHRNQMRMQPALQCIEKATAMEPNNIPAWHNYGIILEDFGRFEDSERAYVRGLQLNNLVSPLQQGVCYSRMRRGLFLDATTLELWQVHRWWALEMPELRRWQGEPLAGKRIIVWREGGAGDHIFFLRYLGLLKDHGAHVTLFGLKQHRGLLTGHPFIDRWLDSDDEFDSQQFDYQISLFAIPAVTKRFPLPMGSPYLLRAPRPVRKEAFTVGICLKAGEKSKTGRLSRSVPTELAQYLEPSSTDAVFFSLQREPLPEWISPCEKENSNWKATAELIAQCDLVISVDTAVAHMAGTMGKPVWTILPAGSDWRWGLSPAKSSPWYPTMSLFRNQHVTDYEELMDQVATKLAWRIAQRAQSVAVGAAQ